MANIIDSKLITVSTITSGNRRLIKSVKKVAKITKTLYARMELDSHADSIVVGENCCIISLPR